MSSSPFEGREPFNFQIDGEPVKPTTLAEIKRTLEPHGWKIVRCTSTIEKTLYRKEEHKVDAYDTHTKYFYATEEFFCVVFGK